MQVQWKDIFVLGSQHFMGGSFTTTGLIQLRGSEYKSYMRQSALVIQPITLNFTYQQLQHLIVDC